MDVIAITPEDLTAAREVLPEVLKDPAVAAKLAGSRDQPGRVLAYVIPIDYTMQGMIADTGEEWKLFARHATIPMTCLSGCLNTTPDVVSRHGRQRAGRLPSRPR